ncbi:transcription factor Ouib-like [Teleopsis dalmanni]|uniref:transcription factor Ouib-like n=1 Tax=Teleopsis dalmanni TaxID=139649 RepID=UPI0018CE631F|nr:transcription factor Ouib-like [Teleopsis dalmanni]
MKRRMYELFLSENVKGMPLYNLCRICLIEDTSIEAMTPLFDNSDKRCIEIVKQIEECGGIELKQHEEFPKMICYQCLESLKTSHRFRNLCQASENALLSYIVKSEVKLETEEFSTAANNSLRTTEVDDDMFLELHTEFIDAQEIDLTDIADDKDNIQISDIDDVSSVEFIDESISEIESSDEEFKLKKKVKPRKVGKPGRPRLKDTVPKITVKREKNKKLEGEKAIMCEICGNIYATRSHLNMHMRRHMSEKPFVCEICQKTFACAAEISRHMRVHTGEKPYRCKFCGRTFSDRSSNIKHERIHTNTRPFTCTTCGKSFTYSNVLKNHMLTHTGEKPFSCSACNKTFSRKHQLDQHCGTFTHQQTVKNLNSTTTDFKQNTVILQIDQSIDATNEY